MPDNNPVDWNDEAVREAARDIVDGLNELLEAAKQFAPGHEEEYLKAIDAALVCDHPGCDCGGAELGHHPLPFPNQCPVHRHCICGGHYHQARLKLNYGSE